MLKMENKGNFKEEEEQYCCNNIVNIEEDHDHGDERNITSVKRTISCHPFYPVLLESHLDCLKLCLGEKDGIIDAVGPADHIKLLDSSVANQPDLDLFMEAYCMTLKKLKQAIEQPQRDSMAFIRNMHSQLDKLKECPSPAASSLQSKGKLT